MRSNSDEIHVAGHHMADPAVLVVIEGDAWVDRGAAVRTFADTEQEHAAGGIDQSSHTHRPRVRRGHIARECASVAVTRTSSLGSRRSGIEAREPPGFLSARPYSCPNVLTLAATLDPK
jgi:hypothetical protein